MKIVKTKNTRSKVKQVKSLIKSAGNQMIGVTFVKREDGALRKICGRFRVNKPQYAASPSGKKMKYSPRSHNLATIFDCNALKYNSRGRLNGRGAWKCFGMDAVKRMKVNGEIYKFV